MQPLNWRTSSYSGAPTNECVEVADTYADVHVRDTKDRTRPGLTVPTATWRTFTTALTGGLLDRQR
ncbi:DUF397 domain-containing protein [Streptomyces sp. NPDC005953]|uniref:DUF397 domain-containing protein n=1 Tax=Streptomyces sp. NPDC005953 TaxID=3156719 RepID=UPI0033F444B7